MTTDATGRTSHRRVETQPGGHRATALRPRRLVGRDREIAEVIESVALTPLTTVTGPGGVGKTALAQAVAARGGAVSRWCVRRLAGLLAVGRAHRRRGGRTGRDAEVRRSVRRGCAHPLAGRT